MSAAETSPKLPQPAHISPHFTSIGCNRDGQCLSWDHTSNLIAYGGANLVAVYNVNDNVNSIIATMKGHTQDISAVKFFPPNSVQLYRDAVNSTLHQSNTKKTDYLITKVASGCFGGKVCIFDLYQANTTEFSPSALKTSIPPPPSITTTASTTASSNDQSFYYKLSQTITLPTQTTSIIQLSLFTINTFTFLVILTAAGGVFVYAQCPQKSAPTTQTTPQNTANSEHSKSGSSWILLQEMYFHLSQLIQISQMTLYPHPEQSILLLALGGVDGTLTLLGSTIPMAWASESDLITFVADTSITAINPHSTPNPKQTKFFTLLGSLKGHRDWIRDIAFSPTQYDQYSDDLTKVYLATGSQDKTIRILFIHLPPKDVLSVLKRTKLTTSSSPSAHAQTSSNPAIDLNDTTSSLDTISDPSSPELLNTSLLTSSTLGENGHLWLIDSTPLKTSLPASSTSPPNTSKPVSLAIATTLETVLFGHENWVMSLEWFQQDSDDYSLSLLSVSTDRTIIEWVQQDYTNTTSMSSEMAQHASLWVPRDKIGEGLGYLCYYGGAYGPNANRVVAISYNGALSMWERNMYGKTQKSEKLNEGSQSAAVPRQAVTDDGIHKPWYPIHCPTGHNKPVLDVISCHGDDGLNINIMKSILAKNDAQSDAQNDSKSEKGDKGEKNVKDTTLYGITSNKWVGPQLPYIVTISQDQTSRVYSPFVNAKTSQAQLSSQTIQFTDNSAITTPSMLQYPWYELSRAQIHGWDLCAVTHVNVDSKTSSIHHHEFMSAGEEKVLRLFRAPALFIAQLYAISSDIEWSQTDFKQLLHTLITPNEHHQFLTPARTLTNSGQDHIGPTLPSQTQSPSQLDLSSTYTRSLCAIQPKLGLSNKPMLVGDEISTATELEVNFGQDSRSQTQQLTIEMLLSTLPTQKSLITPPYEEQLSTTTLWSEIDKLYGHGYDISTLSTTKSAHLLPAYPQLNTKVFEQSHILSTNHARKAKNAGVRQWALSTENLFGDEGNTEHWEEKDILYGHQQTVSCIRPSSDNNFILTVGRDMQITIFGLHYPPATANAEDPKKASYKPISLLPNAHSRQIFHCSWVFDMISTPTASTTPEISTPTTARTTKSFTKYLTTCGRDKTIKIWSYNPTIATATKSITPVQTIKVSQVPTALYSIVSLPIIPGLNADLQPFLSKSEAIEQVCTNYLFVGFENGDMSIYSASIDVIMTPLPTQNTQNEGITLPYTIEAKDPSKHPSFTLHTTFDTSFTHNATVHKITAFPQVVNDQTALQQQPIHLATEHQEIALISVSDDHSVKIFSVKL